jgi:two-component system, LuxR family, sensor kinase FixL
MNDAELKLLFESVLETAVDGIINIDSKGNIIRFNDAAQNLFEFSKEEVIGNNVRMLMNTHDSERHDSYVNRYIETKQAKIIGIRREVLGKTKSGELFPFRLAVSEVILNDQIIF